MHLVFQLEKTFTIWIPQTRINISECRYLHAWKGIENSENTDYCPQKKSFLYWFC